MSLRQFVWWESPGNGEPHPDCWTEEIQIR